MFLDTNLTRRLRRGSVASDSESEAGQEVDAHAEEDKKRRHSSWQRILLLIIAITVHNIPGNFELVNG